MTIAGIDYDASRGIVVSAARVTSTIIPVVVEGYEFWLLLMLNIAVVITRKMGVFTPHYWHLDLPWGLTGVTGSLMTFFVVFYNSHVFSRYNRLYDLAKDMSENCLRAATMLRVQVPDSRVQQKVAKLLLASCFLYFFMRVSHAEEPIDWALLKRLGLLDDGEVEDLKRYRGIAKRDWEPNFMVLLWAMETLRVATPEPETRGDMLFALDDCMIGAWRCQLKVTRIIDLPMPFQYFHIMNLMLTINLILWAYALGCQDSYFAPIIYMFVQMMFQGIRELATSLANPFGTEEVDFPLNSWMQTLYSQMYGVLHDHGMKASEMDLSQFNRPSRGRRYIQQFLNLNVDKEAENQDMVPGTPDAFSPQSKAGPSRAIAMSRLSSSVSRDLGSHPGS